MLKKNCNYSHPHECLWKKHTHKFDQPKPSSELVLSIVKSDDEEHFSDQSSDISVHSSDGENDTITLIESKVANNLNGTISSS